MVRRVIPNIRSDNPAVGREFYTDVLGLQVVMDLGWIVTFASAENPSAQLTVVHSDPSLPHPDYSIEVVDVDACYCRARKQGWEILHPLSIEPWGVKRFFVRDPHGKIANVMQHEEEQRGQILTNQPSLDDQAKRWTTVPPGMRSV